MVITYQCVAVVTMLGLKIVAFAVGGVGVGGWEIQKDSKMEC